MELLHYLDGYLLARDVTPEYADLLRARLRKFSAWKGGVLIGELTCDMVNRYLAFLASTGVKPVTVSNYRRSILAVWNAAYMDGDNDVPPLRVRKIKTPRDAIEAFSHYEIQKLVEYAATFKDYFPNGVSRADFWQGLIHAGYSTGLRRGDLLKVKRSQIAENGVAYIRQNKTGYPVTVRFSAEAMAAIGRMAREDERAFPWPYHENALARQFRAIVKGAGQVRKGQFKWLRRSAGSYGEAAQPGTGHVVLGQRSPQVFRQHYDAPAITRASPVSPPPLAVG